MQGGIHVTGQASHSFGDARSAIAPMNCELTRFGGRLQPARSNFEYRLGTSFNNQAEESSLTTGPSSRTVMVTMVLAHAASSAVQRLTISALANRAEILM
jgi:hypothetical protein